MSFASFGSTRKSTATEATRFMKATPDEASVESVSDIAVEVEVYWFGRGLGVKSP
ncbi:hypothetical protein Slin15195_G067870 [Septoria linicola]|uniref:Uncharacterized protein n=1 Tax=Septoria linicola TaxID=215465 RepID=A0A9Q9AUK0_9PEZI|nr:hypothetical protein Slin15195_G067870 [Septoria linicola]